MLHLVYPSILALLFCALLGIFFYKYYWYRAQGYIFAMSGVLAERTSGAGTWRRPLLNILRALSLLLITLAIARPIQIAHDSPIEVEGIDIILALDVSDSMICFDDIDDQRSRISIARSEAKKFVEKRQYDQIGLVLFGAETVARLPLSLDKKPLLEVLDALEVGVIDSRATTLMVGLLSALNRLTPSQAKSKIIIALTDGVPTEGDMRFKPVVFELAKKLGVKIYTIGIGSPTGLVYYYHPQDPFHNLMQGHVPLNEALLQEIASSTGGSYFSSQTPQDLHRIYKTIDALEKTSFKTPSYTQGYELGIFLLMGAMVLLCIEFILHTLLWRML